MGINNPSSCLILVQNTPCPGCFLTTQKSRCHHVLSSPPPGSQTLQFLLISRFDKIRLTKSLSPYVSEKELEACNVGSYNRSTTKILVSHLTDSWFAAILSVTPPSR
ncbi:hypothetical protein J6590_036180 [Homalodisca vitripennis]|nr:hypothetical protein J6590_036180 [Homalodisca vitripennis]